LPPLRFFADPPRLALDFFPALFLPPRFLALDFFAADFFFPRVALALLAANALAVAPANASPALQRPPLSRAAQLADLEVVRTHYQPKEMAYTPATRAQAHRPPRRRADSNPR
jgi:hypothetical protein